MPSGVTYAIALRRAARVADYYLRKRNRASVKVVASMAIFTLVTMAQVVAPLVINANAEDNDLIRNLGFTVLAATALGVGNVVFIYVATFKEGELAALWGLTDRMSVAMRTFDDSRAWTSTYGAYQFLDAEQGREEEEQEGEEEAKQEGV